MSIYVVMLQVPSPAVWQKVKENWPDRHYIWHDHTAFIAPTGVVTSGQIGDILGFNEEGKNTGIVSELSSLQSGYATTRLVEWIRNASHG